ncbi:MAG: SRPBCC family protein [Flavobacteriaceae bacterium]
MYELHTKQKLPISVEEAWGFFSDPKNLKEITPPYMGFDILSGADRKVYAGQIIRYTVKPLLGLKLNWVTEITHVAPGQFFVDEQRFGPYTFWHHKHFLHSIESGVEMEDWVHYKLPMGPLGQWAHALFVRRQLQGIFDYRTEKLNSLFGTYNDKR